MISGILLFSILGYLTFKVGLLNQRELFFNVNKNVFSSYILILDIYLVTQSILNNKIRHFELFVFFKFITSLY